MGVSKRIPRKAPGFPWPRIKFGYPLAGYMNRVAFPVSTAFSRKIGRADHQGSLRNGAAGNPAAATEGSPRYPFALANSIPPAAKSAPQDGQRDFPAVANRARPQGFGQRAAASSLSKVTTATKRASVRAWARSLPPSAFDVVSFISQPIVFSFTAGQSLYGPTPANAIAPPRFYPRRDPLQKSPP